MFNYIRYLIPSETLATTYLLNTEDVVKEDDTPYPYEAVAYLPIYSAIIAEIIAIYRLIILIIS